MGVLTTGVVPRPGGLISPISLDGLDTGDLGGDQGDTSRGGDQSNPEVGGDQGDLGLGGDPGSLGGDNGDPVGDKGSLVGETTGKLAGGKGGLIREACTPPPPPAWSTCS